MKKTIPAESLKGTTMQLITAMETANERNKSEGIYPKGNKSGNKYLQVSKRLEIFREIFGIDYGIDTNILVNDGKTVVVQAKIYLNDKLIGSGLAEEIRGKGFVNETSAVENCETSAIGRALASLGIHGGEYASINEIEKAESTRQHNKKVNQNPQPAPQPKPQPVQEIKDEPSLSPEENAWHKISLRWIQEIVGMKSQASLLAWITRNNTKYKELIAWDKANNKSLSKDVELTFNQRKEDLENGNQ